MCSTAVLYVTLCMQSQFCYDMTPQQENMPISACVQTEIKSSAVVKLEMGAATCSDLVMAYCCRYRKFQFQVGCLKCNTDFQI